MARFNLQHPGLRAATIAVACLAMSATVVGCTSHSGERPVPTQETAALPGIDLLKQDWQYMPGVTRQGNELAISPTGFTIVKQDGSGGQPNQPVNLYGTHLEGRGDFKLTATIDHNQGDASIELYAAPPVTADEFRIEPGSIRVTEKGSMLSVQVFDGSKQANVQNPQPVFAKNYPITSKSDETLSIARHAGNIEVDANSQLVATIPEGAIFDTGSVWLGLDSTQGGYKLRSLNIDGIDGGQVHAVDTSTEQLSRSSGGLQDLANKVRPGFKVGAAVALGPIASDKEYAQTVVNNFGIVTLENAMKPQFIAPQPGVFDFKQADAIIAFAKKNNIEVHGHTIAFSEATPHWMNELPTATAADRTRSGQILLNYATTVASHFKDSLTSLDVINEPFDRNGGTDQQQNIWYKVFGPNYAANVLAAVHGAAPQLKLVVNENGAEQAGDRQEAFFSYIKDLKDQGAPIYAVGLQSHVYDLNTDTIAASDLNSIINRFAGIGVKVRISEMDVVDDQGLLVQAQQYSTVFRTCLANPNCISWTTWGVTDKYDVFQADDGSVDYGADLLFDAQERPTPAYNAIRQDLQPHS